MQKKGPKFNMIFVSVISALEFTREKCFPLSWLMEFMFNLVLLIIFTITENLFAFLCMIMINHNK